MGNQSWEDSDSRIRTLLELLRGKRSRDGEAHPSLATRPPVRPEGRPAAPDSGAHAQRRGESRMSDTGVPWARRRESRPGYPQRKPDVDGAA